MAMATATGHRHNWHGKMRSCEKGHRRLDGRKWLCSHWTCRTCGALSPENFSTYARCTGSLNLEQCEYGAGHTDPNHVSATYRWPVLTANHLSK
jgi:hypothetical protein